MKRILRFLKPFVLEHWVGLLVFFLCSLGWSIESTLFPRILGDLIDTLTAHDQMRQKAFSAVGMLLLSLGVLWFFVEVAYRIKQYVESKIIPSLEARIRMRAFEHVINHSPKYFQNHFSGTFAHKIQDLVSSPITIIRSLGIIFPIGIMCLLVILFFFNVQPIFAGILCAWMALHTAVIVFFLPRCAAYSDARGKARSDLSGQIADTLSHNYIVNLFAAFSYEKKRIGRFQLEEKQKHMTSLRYGMKMFFVNSALFLITSFGLMGILISYWLNGDITTGEIVQVINTSMNVMFAMYWLGQLLPEFSGAWGVLGQALTILEDPQDVVDPPHALPLLVTRGEISIENLSFSYGTKSVFERQNFHIRKGEKVGLVGRSGAGKSTLIQLLLRFYSPSSGRICIDGQNIEDVTLKSLRSQVSLVPQDPLLFHRSLRENITYGCPDASLEDVQRVCEMSHIHDFIAKLPEGYDTQVGEKGVKLSGGERQRVAIARAMLLNAPILLLDEATSALDSMTERYIQESLDQLLAGKTCLIIAHRLATLAKMDRIIVLDKGEMIEEGTHQELLAKGGHYALMWNMQIGGFLPV